MSQPSTVYVVCRVISYHNIVRPLFAMTNCDQKSIAPESTVMMKSRYNRTALNQRSLTSSRRQVYAPRGTYPLPLLVLRLFGIFWL